MSAEPVPHDIPTEAGTAQVRVHPPASGAARRGTLLLGHGAGGQRDGADLLALTELSAEGFTVVRVTQPWRVAGRRVAGPPATLDLAWRGVLAALGEDDRAPDGTALPRPWVLGGRSAGARVACRTSVTADGRPLDGVAGVLCLAFPLHPPGRPDRSRAAELALPVAAGLPTLVVQGHRDPMGTPEQVAAAVAGEALRILAVPGAHSPTRDLEAVRAAARDLLHGLTHDGSSR